MPVEDGLTALSILLLAALEKELGQCVLGCFLLRGAGSEGSGFAFLLEGARIGPIVNYIFDLLADTFVILAVLQLLLSELPHLDVIVFLFNGDSLHRLGFVIVLFVLALKFLLQRKHGQLRHLLFQVIGFL